MRAIIFDSPSGLGSYMILLDSCGAMPVAIAPYIWE
jgi:hypothetical protein